MSSPYSVIPKGVRSARFLQRASSPEGPCVRPGNVAVQEQKRKVPPHYSAADECAAPLTRLGMTSFPLTILPLDTGSPFLAKYQLLNTKYWSSRNRRLSDLLQ